MVWYGVVCVVWYGMVCVVWCGVVWCGVVWYGVCGVVRCGVVAAGTRCNRHLHVISGGEVDLPELPDLPRRRLQRPCCLAALPSILFCVAFYANLRRRARP